MNLMKLIQDRYSAKVYDPDKKISEEDFARVKELIRASPSSLNLQPWVFIVADDEAGKRRVAKGTTGMYAINQDKVMDASHLVIYCAKTTLSEAHVEQVSEAEDRDGRYRTTQSKLDRRAHMNGFIRRRRELLNDVPSWNALQLYLNLGFTLLGVEALGINATPMEGIDLDALDKEFDLQAQGLKALAVVAFGYSSEDDYNEKLPKSRLPEAAIFRSAKDVLRPLPQTA